MIFHNISLRPILSDRLRPPSFPDGKRFNAKHFALIFVLPFVAAVALALRYPVINKDYQPTILAIFGMVAAVLTALLPIIPAVIGNVQVKDKYERSQHAVWVNLANRLDVLRGLYSAISWAVILLVLSLVPVLILQIQNLPALVGQILAGMIYFVGLSVAVAFLEIVAGVYQVLMDQAKQISQKLKDSKPDE